MKRYATILISAALLAAWLMPASLLAEAASDNSQYAGKEILWKEPYSAMREEMSYARPIGMGRAFIAIAEGNAAYLYNPAGIAQKTMYSIGLQAEVDPKGQAMAFGASVLDAVTSAVAAEVGYAYHGYDSFQLWGIENIENPEQFPNGANELSFLDQVANQWCSDAYTGRRSTSLEQWCQTHTAGDRQAVFGTPYYENDGDVTAVRRMFGRFKDAKVHRHISRVSISGAATKWLMLGATAKYAYVQRPDRHTVNAVNVDLGVMIKTEFGLQLGVVGYNLIHTAYDLWPLKLGAGVAFNYENMFYIAYDQIIRFDVFREWEPHNQSLYYQDGTQLASRVGAEFVIMNVVPIRGGYEWDQYIDDHMVSGGLGYRGEQFSLDISYNQALKHRSDRLLSFGLEFKI